MNLRHGLPPASDGLLHAFHKLLQGVRVLRIETKLLGTTRALITVRVSSVEERTRVRTATATLTRGRRMAANAEVAASVQCANFTRLNIFIKLLPNSCSMQERGIDLTYKFL